MDEKPAYMREQKSRVQDEKQEFESLEDMQFVPKNKFEANQFM